MFKTDNKTRNFIKLTSSPRDKIPKQKARKLKMQA